MTGQPKGARPSHAAQIRAELDGLAASVVAIARIVETVSDDTARADADALIAEITRLRLTMSPAIRIDDILRSVASIYRVTASDILSDRRDQPIAMARHAVMLLAHHRGMQRRDIAKALNRERTTVNHGIAAAKQRLAAFEAKRQA